MSARMHSLSSSSEDSSLDHQEQSSSYASFCSTHSYHTNGSYMSNEHCIEPPDSILFLDHDDNVNSLQDHRLNIAVQNDHCTEDRFPAVDVENVDQFFNEDMSHADDVSTQSANSLPEKSHLQDGQKIHHRFDQMSRTETASYKIMTLLDNAGAPRICYNRLVALLKKLSRHEGFDVKKALNRETLMRRLERRYKRRPKIQNKLVNNQEVFRFTFHDMSQLQ